jgi:hypothetical protein
VLLPSRRAQQAVPVAHVRVHHSLAQGFEPVDISNPLDDSQDRRVGRREFLRALANQYPPFSADAAFD